MKPLKLVERREQRGATFIVHRDCILMGKRIREKEKARKRKESSLEYCTHTPLCAPYYAVVRYFSEHLIRTVTNLTSRNIFAIQIWLSQLFRILSVII